MDLIVQINILLHRVDAELAGATRKRILASALHHGEELC